MSVKWRNTCPRGRGGTEPRALRGLIREAFVPTLKERDTLAQARGKTLALSFPGQHGGRVPAFAGGGGRPGGHTGRPALLRAVGQSHTR